MDPHASSASQTIPLSDVAALISGAAVRSVYQPIVDLADGRVIAYEALARGPVGHPLESPDALFAAALNERRISDLDELCIRTALAGAATQLAPLVPLFINVEPSTLDSDLIRRTAPIPAAGGRPIMLEITERAITRSLEALLTGVATAREHGWRIALDDVGVEPGSLALLPIIRPEVVKLDMALVRDEPDLALGRTMSAVMAYAERTGATILAEGIETDEHLDRAIALGATLGQGYRFGRPGALPPTPTPPPSSSASGVPYELRVFGSPRAIGLSPFEAVVAIGVATRTATKSVLLQISHHIEEQAGVDPSGPIILSAFQEARHFTPATVRRYERLTASCTIVGALGVGLEDSPAPGVRGGRLLPGDPLTDEWSVVVLGPHYAGALLAKDLGDAHTVDGERRFDFVVTHDRHLVELAAESLLRRLIST